MESSIETAADLAPNYSRHRFAQELAESPTAHPDGYVCQNCGKITDRLTPVPEFDYLGCDDCMAEALIAIERERALLAEIMQDAGVTRQEGEAFFTWIDRRPVVVERVQGELFPGFNPQEVA